MRSTRATSDVKLVTPRKKKTSSTGSSQQEQHVASRDPSSFEGPSVLEPLVGKCFRLMESQYEYSVCPFRNVTQAETHGTRSLYILGIWDRYEVQSSSDTIPFSFYDNGTSCGHAIHRKSFLRMTCVNDENSGSIVVDLSSSSSSSSTSTLQYDAEEEEEEEDDDDDKEQEGNTSNEGINDDDEEEMNEEEECDSEEEIEEEEENILDLKIQNTRLVHVRETETCVYEITLQTPFVCGLTLDMFPGSEILLEEIIQLEQQEKSEDDTSSSVADYSSSSVTHDNADASAAMAELFRVLDQDDSNSIDLTEFMSLEDAFEPVSTLTLQRLNQVLKIVTSVQEHLQQQQH